MNKRQREQESNLAFQSFTTSLAFHFNITKQQAWMLDLLMKGDNETLAPFGRFIPCVRGLIRRGLVFYDASPIKGPVPIRAYHVTEAGKLVHRLLQLAEVVPNTKPTRKAAA